MTDLATIEQEVESGIVVAEPVVNAVVPALATVPGLGWLSVVWTGIKAIIDGTGKSLPAATAEWVSHNTPGMPNSPTLSGQ
jgi:hypothetical protein